MQTSPAIKTACVRDQKTYIAIAASVSACHGIRRNNFSAGLKHYRSHAVPKQKSQATITAMECHTYACVCRYTTQESPDWSGWLIP